MLKKIKLLVYFDTLPKHTPIYINNTKINIFTYKDKVYIDNIKLLFDLFFKNNSNSKLKNFYDYIKDNIEEYVNKELIVYNNKVMDEFDSNEILYIGDPPIDLKHINSYEIDLIINFLGNDNHCKKSLLQEIKDYTTNKKEDLIYLDKLTLPEYKNYKYNETQLYFHKEKLILFKQQDKVYLNTNFIKNLFLLLFKDNCENKYQKFTSFILDNIKTHILENNILFSNTITKFNGEIIYFVSIPTELMFHIKYINLNTIKEFLEKEGYINKTKMIDELICCMS